MQNPFDKLILFSFHIPRIKFKSRGFFINSLETTFNFSTGLFSPIKSDAMLRSTSKFGFDRFGSFADLVPINNLINIKLNKDTKCELSRENENHLILRCESNQS